MLSMLCSVAVYLGLLKNRGLLNQKEIDYFSDYAYEFYRNPDSI